MSGEIIAVVGDNHQHRELLAEALRAAGLGPIDTATIAEALSAFSERHPAVLVLDRSRQDAEAHPVIGRLRKVAGLRGSCLVVVGSASTAEIDRAFDEGADDFVDVAHAFELAPRIRHQLDRRRFVTELRRSESQLADTMHDLNQPLTSVLGYAEVLLRQLGETSPLANAARMIVSEAERMAILVRKISKRAKATKAAPDGE